MNKQEALKQIEEQRDMILDLHGWDVFGYIKGIINQLDEPQKIELPKVDFKKSQKVKVLQFVADVIEGAREESPELEDAFKYAWEVATIEFRKWFRKLENRNNFARAWIDGYEVEKESKYIVKVKATGQCLGKYYINNEILSPRFIYTGRHADSFTRKELEEADFSWVFDCDGVGVEEVE